MIVVSDTVPLRYLIFTDEAHMPAPAVIEEILARDSLRKRSLG